MRAPLKRPAVAPLPLPVPHVDGFFSLRVEAFTRSRKGRRLTDEQKAEQRTFADVQAYRKRDAASWLASCFSPELRDYVLGGPLAVLQTPCEASRDEALTQLLVLRSSSEGAALGKVRRALKALAEFAGSNYLPASSLLLNRCVTSASIAALSAATGSQGGASVAASLRSGFKDAQILGLPVQADTLLLDAAAPPGKKQRRERRAGSIPIKWYGAFEFWAANLKPSVYRLVLRQILLTWLHARLRMVDVMRATVSLAGRAADGCPVVMIVTSFSKDGAPIDVYFRAEGILGRFEWITEHVAELARLGISGFAIPAFRCEAKRSGQIDAALEVVLPARTASKPHAIAALKAFTCQVELGADADVWKALGVLPHSGHGSPSDMVAVVGPHAPPDVAMTDVDERELGHWRRLATALSGDGPLQLEPLLEEAWSQVQQPQPAAAPPAMTAQDAEMRVRYTSGTNREGRKRAQMRVHARWILAIRRGLSAAGKSWRDLVGDRSDYDILENIPPLQTGGAATGGSDDEDE